MNPYEIILPYYYVWSRICVGLTGQLDMTASDHQKQTLESLLKQIKSQAQINAEFAEEVRKANIAASENSDFLLNALPTIPTGINLQGITSSAQRLYGQVCEQGSAIQAFAGFASGTLYLNASMGTAIINTFSAQNIVQLTPSQQKSVQAVTENFYNFTSRSDNKNRILDQITRLRLDKTTGGALAIKQLNAAWDEHLLKPQVATASLIPIREAVNHIVNELIKLCPNQQKVEEKITYIGLQLGSSISQPSDFESLQSEWKILNDKLSSSKSGMTSRHQEIELISRTTLFILKLLTALDERRLRNYHSR